MKDVSDKLLIEMYKSTKSETARRKMKEELLTRGYRFTVKDNPWWYFKPGWQVLSAGATVMVLLLIGMVVYAFKEGPQPVESARDYVQQILSVQHNTEVQELKAEVATLRNEINTLTLSNKELTAQYNRTNERLWRFGVMNQENWCRYNAGEKVMAMMDEQWFPNQQLKHLPASVNTRLEQKRTVLEAEEFVVPQPIN